MINLTTGSPGAGKTLFTLWYVQQLAERENRTVYYSGIADLKLPWVELSDPAKWFECPPGAIIVIDECQRLFRPRSYGSQVPEYVSRLETHRHAGHDLFLITQHPMLVDTNVRRLVGCHRHVVRPFGMERCTVHEFPQLRENPDKNRDGSVRHEVGYPREVFDWYQSAEVHTVKRRVPPRVWLLLAVPFILVALVWGVFDSLGRYAGEKSEPAVAEAQPSSGGSVTKAPRAAPAKAEPDWFAARVPRVASLVYTAPVYDEVTKPVEAPAPVACIAQGERCTCYSQQGFRLMVEVSACRQIVERGIHLDWRPAWPTAEHRALPVADLNP